MNTRFALVGLALAITLPTGLISNTTALAHEENALDALTRPLPRGSREARLDAESLFLPSIETPSADDQAKFETFAEPLELSYDIETGAETAASSIRISREPEETARPVELATLGYPGSVVSDGPAALTSGIERSQVPDSTAYPWRAVCKVLVTFPDGARYAATGTLVSEKHVLTAGHCIYSKAHGGFPKLIEVIPGLDGDYMPFGKVYGSTIRTFANWTQGNDAAYDLALITLMQNVGASTGWFGMGKSNKLATTPVTLAAYPQEVDGGLTQCYQEGTVTSVDATMVRHTLAADDGASGGALLKARGDQFSVTAVQIGRDGQQNRALRLNGQRLSYLKGWIAADK